jgi:hypothetical protein
MAKDNPVKIEFMPKFSGSANAVGEFIQVARDIKALLAKTSDIPDNVLLERHRTSVLSKRLRMKEESKQAFWAAVSVLIDIVKQGWEIIIEKKTVYVRRPVIRSKNKNVDLIRSQLHAERNEQLTKESTRQFIRSMESRAYHNDGFVSIYSLMRDGRELLDKLSKVGARKDKLYNIIQPYLQFVNGEERCEITGLKLIDIWRYFRHTWASPYKSVPGRTVMILVRDAAVEYHPVMGILALGSSPVGHRPRDEYVGWSTEGVRKIFEKKSTKSFIDWMYGAVTNGIKQLYIADLLSDEVVSHSTLKRPNKEAIKKLQEASKENRNKHYRLTECDDYKKSFDSETKNKNHWKEQAHTNLFRSKRENELAELLSIKLALDESIGKNGTRADLDNFFSLTIGRITLDRIIRKVKSNKVGSAMAELIVCGAVPPYNELLGGKLVAMLALSPEVSQEYKRRYAKQESIIASSMAAKPVVKSTDLVYIGTTSLYGVRPNQYDRVSFPVFNENSRDIVRFKYLGKTKGVGTFQFSETTIKYLTRLVSQNATGVKVNSIFGEGINPRLRKLRDGLSHLGLDSDELLNHGAPRLIYGAKLCKNVEKYFLGLNQTPEFYLSKKKPTNTSEEIAKWWLDRWVTKRLTKKEVSDRILEHTLVHPIKHGARVETIRIDPEQALLFEC